MKVIPFGLFANQKKEIDVDYNTTDANHYNNDHDIMNELNDVFNKVLENILEPR